MQPSSGRLGLAPRLLIFFLVGYGILWISSFPRQYDADELSPDAEKHQLSDSNAPYPVEIDKLVVTIRTTATEAFAKLPMSLLLADTIYHDNINIVSDLHMDIGAFHVHDILEHIDSRIMASNPDLQRHGRQIRLAEASIDLSVAKENNAEKEKEVMAKLDKYKYIRMLEKAWQLKPDRKWYMFVDADTYVFRPNLMHWLGRFDSTEAIFFADAPNSDLPGAGSGAFILSEKVMRKLFAEGGNIAATWDARISDYQSGFDAVVAAMEAELKLGFNRTWPGISSYNPTTAPYGPGLWCEPVLSLHDVSIETASDLWRLQRDRLSYTQEPIAFANLWKRFVQPENLTVPRDDWDNLSSGPDNARYNILFEGIAQGGDESRSRDADGRAGNGEASWEACAEACNNNLHCMQFSYSSIPASNHNENGETKCHLSRNLRLGRHVEPLEIEADGQKVKLGWKSGWRTDKFQAWAQQQRCKGQQDKN
jgi:hypothetical protein